VIAWVAVAAAAGPWVREPGAWYAKASYAEFRTSAFVAPGEGDEAPMAYVGRAASVYAEVGLVRRLQLVAELPWITASNRFPGSALAWTSSGLGSLRAGFGLAPWPGVPVSASAIGRFPLHGHPSALGFAPPLGEEQVDVDLVLAAGASPPLGAQRAWGLLEVGWRERTRLTFARGPRVADFDDAALLRAQLGLVPVLAGRDLGWLFAEADAVVGVGDPRRAVTLGIGAAGNLRRGVRLELGGGQVIDARQESLGWRWSLGLSHQRPGRDARGS
jgi:hypothetical protein